MRHLDIVRHRIQGARGKAYLCVLQSDVAGDAERIVAPVASGHLPDPLSPAVDIEGRPHRIRLRAMTRVPVALLGKAVTSAQPCRDGITRGLDLLFLGV